MSEAAGFKTKQPVGSDYPGNAFQSESRVVYWMSLMSRLSLIKMCCLLGGCFCTCWCSDVKDKIENVVRVGGLYQYRKMATALKILPRY